MPIGNKPYKGLIAGPSNPPRSLPAGDVGFGAPPGTVAPPPHMLDRRLETRFPEATATSGLYGALFACDVAGGWLEIERLFCQSDSLGPIGNIILLTVAPAGIITDSFIEVATMTFNALINQYVASFEAVQPIYVPAGQQLTVMSAGGANAGKVTAQYRVMVP